jgi:hypothetical protein
LLCLFTVLSWHYIIFSRVPHFLFHSHFTPTYSYGFHLITVIILVCFHYEVLCMLVDTRNAFPWSQVFCSITRHNRAVSFLAKEAIYLVIKSSTTTGDRLLTLCTRLGLRFFTSDKILLHPDIESCCSHCDGSRRLWICLFLLFKKCNYGSIFMPAITQTPSE